MIRYMFNGVPYKTVRGLQNALRADSNAAQISMVQSDRRVHTYAADGLTVLASYLVSAPELGKSQIVARIVQS